MKFVDTKRFQPVVYGGDLPHKYDLFHVNVMEVPTTEIRYVKFLKDNNIIIDRVWWKKQWQRCINGFTVPEAVVRGGDAIKDNEEAFWNNKDVFLPQLHFKIHNGEVWISGRMYFYLNFWKMKRLDSKIKRKTVGHPRFTSLSWKNWIIREQSQKFNKDLLWAKRRQCGLTAETAADIGYEYLFLKDSQLAIISGEEKYATNTFNMVKKGIEELRNTQFYKWSSLSNSELLKAKYFGSEIHCRTAKNNEQALSGLSPQKVVLEEAGLWAKGLVKSTAEFINQSLEAEGSKTGQNVFISTAGDMEDSITDIEEMCYNPDKFNLMKFKNIYEKEVSAREADVACFIPGWEFEIIDEDGNSLRKESEEKLLKDRETKSYKERIRATTMKPFYLSELFSNISGGYFGEHIIYLLNQRKAHLFTHKSLEQGRYYRLEWINIKNWDEGLNAIEDEEGEFFIIEHPEKDSNGEVFDNLYKAGVDSYDKDEANESNSKGSMHVFKGFKKASKTYKKFVARLVQRPSISEGGAYMFYENTVKLSIYYNVISLIEWSNIRIFDYYRKNGVEYLLKERPDLTIAKYVQDSRTSNVYGIDPSTKIHWLSGLRDFLSYAENVNKLDDLNQITAFCNFKYDATGKKYNCDTTISSALALVCYEDEMEMEVVAKDTFHEKMGVIVTIEENGILKEISV